jgi:hypothetical protein
MRRGEWFKFVKIMPNAARFSLWELLQPTTRSERYSASKRFSFAASHITLPSSYAEL